VPSRDSRTNPYAGASRTCDIVMKGGITSGVVYPRAVCELARTYRFKNVGGTSAGAIAAAATAAAEHGRDHQGFDKLEALPAWLGEGENLQRLFQPQESTRGLHRLLLSSIGRKRFKPLRILLTAARTFPFSVLAGMAPGIGLIVLAAVDGSGLLRVVAIAAGVLIAAGGAGLAFALRVARRAMRSIPDNGYGLCSGFAEPTAGEPPPLTTWLHEQLGSYCAPLKHGGPLTFGDLWGGPNGDPPPEDPGGRFVQLEMMTTNVTLRRADRLPWSAGGWYFDPDEMRRLFPDDVVRWMEDHPAPVRGTGTRRQRSWMMRALLRPLCPLPPPEHLPVIVATRMSLSFPVLLSAVPLWRVDMSREANQVLEDWAAWAARQGTDWNPLEVDPAEWPDGRPATRPAAERCWFSDGGISSNFPVHFFDRFIPRWPTFGINLRPFHPDHEKSETDECENTYLPPDNAGGIQDWWYRQPARPGFPWLFDTRLPAFLSGVVRTMQNRVDEAQMRVPGYRDRVVHIHHTPDEGGINLTMPEHVIDALTARGRCAAERLVEAYTRDAEAGVISWDNHRWVRLRSSLAVLEEIHERIARSYQDAPATQRERTYAELLDRRAGIAPRSYEMGRELADLARQQLDSVVAAAAAVRDSGKTLSTGAPRPLPEGRIMPRD
jgi:predicted acylesterase/phospholipase RssA